MDISVLGGGTVKLSGKNLTVLCDPNAQTITFKAANRINVVTKSTNDLPSSGDAMVLDAPGEYEVGGAMIVGVGAQRHTDEGGEGVTIFAIELDGVNVVVTGPVAANLTPDQIERLGKIDVLVVQVGGNGLTLEPEEAATLVQKLEPSYVVPVHYDDGISRYEMPQAKLEVFLKEMGVSPEPVAKLRVSTREIPEETQVVVLTPAA